MIHLAIIAFASGSSSGNKVQACEKVGRGCGREVFKIHRDTEMSLRDVPLSFIPVLSDPGSC